MYQDIFTQYSANFAGLVVYAKSNSIIGLDSPTSTGDGRWRVVEATIPTREKVIFTGRYFVTANNTTCYQIRYGNSLSYGYVFEDQLYQFSREISTDPALKKVQDVVDSLIVNNQQILENNLLCARAIELCRERGIVLPVRLRQNLFNLQSRLALRNEKLKNSGYLESYNESVSPQFSLYNQSLIRFMNDPGIGVVITGTVAIVISVVIAVLSAVAAYTLFKSLHAESKTDFKYSDDLTAELLKYLPPETFHKLVNENEANAKAAQRAIDQASGKGTLNTIKYLAIGYLGFFLIDKYFTKK